MSLAVFLVSVLMLACGGSSSNLDPGPPGGSGTVAGTFTPDQPSPGPDTVAMAQGAATGDTVTVEVRVTDTSGIFGAAFDVLYDASHVQFAGWTAGSLLEQGGGTPVYQVGAGTPGRLVVAATRTGSGTASTTGSAPLIRLRFRVLDVGTSAASFDGSPALFDAQLQPQPLPGIGFFGGTLIGS